MVKKNQEYNIYPIIGEILICPICGKEFKATSETRYIRKGKHTCSWKCFLNHDIIPIVSSTTEQPQDKPLKENKNKIKKEKTIKVELF